MMRRAPGSMIPTTIPTLWRSLSIRSTKIFRISSFEGSADCATAVVMNANRKSRNARRGRSTGTASPHDRRRRVRTRYRCAQSLVQEALEAARVEVLADVEIPSAIHRDRMRHVERAAKQSLLAEAGDHLQRLAIEDPDVMVRAVDHVQKPLLRIGRQAED